MILFYVNIFVSYPVATVAVWWCNEIYVYVNINVNVTATRQNTTYQRSEDINYPMVEFWYPAQYFSEFKIDSQFPKSQFCLSQVFQQVTVNMTVSILIVHFCTIL